MSWFQLLLAYNLFFQRQLITFWELESQQTINSNDLINNKYKNELYIYLIHKINHELD